ncbi:hypothetical protein D9M70_364710 [compost metagenome]
MVAAFALREVAVHDGDRIARVVGEGAPDKAPLRVLVVAGKAFVERQRLLAGEQGDAVVTLLAVVVHVVAELANLRFGELVVADLGLL